MVEQINNNGEKAASLRKTRQAQLS